MQVPQTVLDRIEIWFRLGLLDETGQLSLRLLYVDESLAPGNLHWRGKISSRGIFASTYGRHSWLKCLSGGRIVTVVRLYSASLRLGLSRISTAGSRL